jgi:hypothetical protein
MTPLPPSLKDVKNKMDKLKHIKCKLKRAKVVRSIYLSLNRKYFDEIPLKILYNSFKRIPILIRQINDEKIDEKYRNVIIVTFSKFADKYNDLINEQVENICLIRQVLGYDISRIISKYLDFE